MLRFLLHCELALLLCLACGPGAEFTSTQAEFGTDPEALAQRFFQAIATDRIEDLGPLFSERGLLGYRSGEGFRIDSETFGAWSIEELRVEGALAFVTSVTTLDGEEQQLELHFAWAEEQECWLITGLELALPEVGEYQIDFEELGRFVEGSRDPLGPAVELVDDPQVNETRLDALERDRLVREIEGRRASFKAIASTTPRKHENHWKYNLITRGRSARRVLEEILEGTGLALDPDGVIDALDKPLRIEARGISRIEALERVAKALGLVAIYPRTQEIRDAKGVLALRFEPGERAWPVHFEGPFLIAVENLLEHVPVATGTLTLGVFALGMAPAVLGFQDRMYEHVRLTKLVDKRGRDLQAEQGITFISRPEIHGTYWSERFTIELAGLLRSVRRITRLEGRLSLRLPRTVEALRWPQDDPRTRRSLGERTLELSQWDDTLHFRMQGPAHLIAQTEMRFSPLAKNYRAMHVLSDASFGVGNVLTASVETTDVPLRVDIKVCAVEELSYPFALEGIVLQRYEDMPSRPERLVFDGEAPVRPEFVRFQKRAAGAPQIQVRLSNTSNKDVTRLSAEFHYFNDRGVELGTFPHAWASEGAGAAPVALVVRGMTIEETCPAFFLPEDTHEVRIEITEVEFSDASHWPKQASGR